MTDKIDAVVKAAQGLVDAVQHDDIGMMVGNQWVGGNGGLLSRATIAAADRLRSALGALKAEQVEAENAFE